jgi:HPt (histidine-containing phosphotransfer) domain-containing protein
MAALRDEYAQTLPAKLEELSQAVRLAREAAGDPERSRRVQALAHALRGTAGTFGFRDLSVAAGRIEEAAGRPVQGPAAASASSLVEIEDALAAARASLFPRS